MGGRNTNATGSVTRLRPAPLSADQITELAEMFQLMGDPSRLSIILDCLHTPASVSDMAQRLKLSTSLVSHHLRLLRAARLIQAERQGTRVFYLITDPHIRRTLADMTQHVREDGHADDDVARD